MGCFVVLAACYLVFKPQKLCCLFFLDFFCFSDIIFNSLKMWRLSGRLESCVISRAAAEINVTFLLVFVENRVENFVSC